MAAGPLFQSCRQVIWSAEQPQVRGELFSGISNAGMKPGGQCASKLFQLAAYNFN